MRLIDADTLLTQIKYKPVPNIVDETWNELYNRVIEEIDNAPTITPTLQLEDITDEDIAKFVMILQRATSKGVILESERSQGKWIFKHNSSDIWCSVCDENFDEIPQKFNYCPNCGAQMNGGEAHD